MTTNAHPGSASTHKAVGATRDIANSSYADGLARFGLTARGLVYIVMGLLAVAVANGNRKEVDQKGALRELLNQPFGTVMVILLAIGFACYALWRLSEAAFGVTGDPGSNFARVQSAFRGLVYAFFAVTAVAVLRGSHESQAKQQRGLAADVMSHTGGRWLVGIVGLAVVVVGLVLVVEGITRRFMRYFPEGRLDAAVRRVIQVVGVVGNTARGLVFAFVGALVVIGAWTYEPSKVSGIDGAVKTLRDHSLTFMLVLAGLGLVVFGCYGLLEARYRRV